MKRLFASLLLAAGLSSAATVQAQAGRTYIDLKDIHQALVPTSNPRGDREFAGNGPRIRITVKLTSHWDGRAILATVRMAAVEMGGDRSTTTGIWRKIVWDQRNQRIPLNVKRILGTRYLNFEYISIPGRNPLKAYPGGLPRGVVKIEDGGYVKRIHQPGRTFLQYLDVMGDTTGSDISTNGSAHGNTSIRYIKLGRILVDADVENRGRLK